MSGLSDSGAVGKAECRSDTIFNSLFQLNYSVSLTHDIS